MIQPLDRMRPVYRGEVWRDDFLMPLGLRINALAAALDVPATRIHEIVKDLQRRHGAKARRGSMKPCI